MAVQLNPRVETSRAEAQLAELGPEARRVFIASLRPLGRRGVSSLRRRTPVGSRRATVRSVRSGGKNGTFTKQSVKPGTLRRAVTFKVERRTASIRLGFFGSSNAAKNAFYRHFVIAGTKRHSIRRGANRSSRQYGVGSRGGFVSARPNPFVSRFGTRFQPVAMREVQRRLDAFVRARNARTA